MHVEEKGRLAQQAKSQLEDAGKEIRKLEQENVELQNELNTVSKELDITSQKYRDIDKINSEAMQTIVKMEAEQDKFERDIQDYQSQIK